MKKQTHICLVCAYPGLAEPPRTKSGGGSYEICPSCGYQFGVDDDDKEIPHATWRKKWQAAGSKWSSKSIPQPKNWKPAKPAAKKSAPKPRR